MAVDAEYVNRDVFEYTRPMIATALIASVGDGKQFRNGRQMAASLGLTPRQHSSGGKERLLGISKRGDSYHHHSAYFAIVVDVLLLVNLVST